MEKEKFTDGEVLVKLEEHLDYECNQLGVKPTYTIAYSPTAEELENKPKSPLCNW